MFPHHSTGEIIQQLRLHTQTPQSYHASGRASVRTPESGGSFNAEIYHRSKGKLYMTISPGLGIVAVRALVTPDSFFVYNRLKDELVYGSRARAAAHLPIVLPEDDLFGAMLGLLVPSAGVDWQLVVDSAYYHLESGNRRYTVDPAIWRIVAFEQRNRRGEVVETRAYREFDRIEGHYLPRRVVLRRPQEQTVLQLYYGAIDLAPENMRDELDVSPSAKRVPVGPSSP